MIGQLYFVKTPLFVKSIFKDLVWSINTDKKVIYLTFDDGPTPVVTNWVLNLLKQYNAKATFFCLGKNVANEPELYHRIIEEGHVVGNHTYNHFNGWKTKNKAYFSNIDKAQKVIQSPFFRPPYGKITNSQIAHLKPNFKLIMWDILSGDFDLSISPEKCAENVLKNAKKGSIVVFHDSIKAENNLKVALPKTLEYFSKLGFSFDVLPD